MTDAKVYVYDSSAEADLLASNTSVPISSSGGEQTAHFDNVNHGSPPFYVVVVVEDNDSHSDSDGRQTN